jgi:hypothetical protein
MKNLLNKLATVLIVSVCGFLIALATTCQIDQAMLRTVAGEAYAQEPDPTPVAPKLVLPVTATGDVGAFIAVTAETNGTQVRWVSMTPGLNVFPAELLRDSRSTVVTASREGDYTLLAYTALGNVPSQPSVMHVIVGQPVPPEPGPGPGPTPPPSPLPDGKYKFAKLAYDQATKIPAASRAKAGPLAENYQALADSFRAAIAAGATPSIPEGLASLKERNRVTLGSDITAWGNWGVAWAEKANGHNADGSLKTAADYADAWAETAAGLKAVR